MQNRCFGFFLWFISGDTNIKYLNDNGVRIWNEWADENGDLGPVYGAQWRSWRTFDKVPDDVATRDIYVPGEPVDQLANLIEGLKTNPYGRRHIINAWNVGEVDDMALPPCHLLVQFFVKPLDEGYLATRIAKEEMRLHADPDECWDGGTVEELWETAEEYGILSHELSCQLFQRSADVFLGVPFNIASYATLTYLLADAVNMVPGEFVHTFGDVHIYNNHVPQVLEQLSREPRALPTLSFKHMQPLLDDQGKMVVKFDDMVLSGYDPHPRIKAEVSV